MSFTDKQLVRIKAACLYYIEEYNNADAKDILALIARLEAAEDIQNGERCEACPDQGWYGEMYGGVDSDGENDTREAIQIKCQFCYENPKSVFNKIRIWCKSKGEE